MEVTAVGDDESDRAKVAQEIMQVRKKKGGLKVVQGRGLQLGDAALIDFDAKRSDTGEEFAGAKRRKTHMDTDSADMQFLPGRLLDPGLVHCLSLLYFLCLLPCCGDHHMLLALVHRPVWRIWSSSCLCLQGGCSVCMLSLDDHWVISQNRAQVVVPTRCGLGPSLNI